MLSDDTNLAYSTDGIHVTRVGDRQDPSSEQGQDRGVKA